MHVSKVPCLGARSEIFLHVQFILYMYMYTYYTYMYFILLRELAKICFTHIFALYTTCTCAYIHVCVCVFFVTGPIIRADNTYGKGTGPVWMRVLLCAGTEENIIECNHRTDVLNSPCDNHAMETAIECRVGGISMREREGGGRK